MRRAFLIVIAVLAAAVLAVEFELIPVYHCIWEGQYDLLVHVISFGNPPASVGCFTVSRSAEANELCASSPSPADFPPGWPSAIADPFAGQPLKVPVWVSGRTSALGREVAWYQPRFLLVTAEWPGGRRACKVVEIPDGRVSRKVNSSIP